MSIPSDYTFYLTDPTYAPLGVVHALEGNGTGGASTPRQIINIDFDTNPATLTINNDLSAILTAALFTGSIATTVLTVTAVASGTLAPGQEIPAAATNTTIVKQLTGTPITAGFFIIGRTYIILTIGSTDFTLIGAASNTVGLQFIATGAGTGTGTATLEGGDGTYAVSVSQTLGVGVYTSNSIFDIIGTDALNIDLPYDGAGYRVAAPGSVYDTINNVTYLTLDITTPLVPSPFAVTGVTTGVSGTWTLSGPAHGNFLFYPTATFDVTGNAGIGVDGTYTVLSSTSSNPTYPIIGVFPNPALNVATWTISGNHTSEFVANQKFQVADNTAIGLYTVSSITPPVYSAPNTIITVQEAIPATASASGLILSNVTIVTVSGSIPGTATVSGQITPPVPTQLEFNGLAVVTGTFPNFTVAWKVAGNKTAIFTPNFPFVLKDNSFYPYRNLTVSPTLPTTHDIPSDTTTVYTPIVDSVIDLTGQQLGVFAELNPVPNVGLGTWTIVGDFTHKAVLVPGKTLTISGGAPNPGAGTYTISNVVLVGLNTVITVVEPIPALADSSGYLFISNGYLLFAAPPQPYGYLQYATPKPLTSLQLVGKGAAMYNNSTTWGQALQDNQIHMLENFANGINLINAGFFEVGLTYTISTIGTTDFTLIGASANTVGVVFIATGAGSGTGTAFGSATPPNPLVGQLFFDRESVVPITSDYLGQLTYHDYDGWHALATKAYVDAATAGLNVHLPVEAATTVAIGDIPVTVTPGVAGPAPDVGVGVGYILTQNSPWTNSIAYYFDTYGGIIVGTRLLVKNQADQTQNGIYVVTTVGVATVSPFVLTRASDYDNSVPDSVIAGDYVYVSEGTTLAGTSWVETGVGTGTGDVITIGTDNIIFSQFGSGATYTGTSPIDVTGTVISLTTVPVNLGGTGLATVTSNALLLGNGVSPLTVLPVGTNGNVLTVVAGVPAWQTPTPIPTIVWSVKTTTYLAVATDGIFADTTGGPFTVTLPITPTLGDTIYFEDVASMFNTNNLTIARNGENIMGVAADMTVSTQNASFSLVYSNSTYGWRII